MLLCHLSIFFSKISACDFCPFSIWLFLNVEFGELLIYSGYSSLDCCVVCKHFISVYSLHFPTFNRVIHRFFLILKSISYQIFLLCVMLLVSSLWNLCLVPDPEDFLWSFFLNVLWFYIWVSQSILNTFLYKVWGLIWGLFFWLWMLNCSNTI